MPDNVCEIRVSKYNGRHICDQTGTSPLETTETPYKTIASVDHNDLEFDTNRS